MYPDADHLVLGQRIGMPTSMSPALTVRTF
jgi:hypothetical protein